jgi:hypothetical protein
MSQAKNGPSALGTVRLFLKVGHGSSLSYKLPTSQLFAIIGMSKTERKELTCGCTTR